jgi:hypothetical protein
MSQKGSKPKITACASSLVLRSLSTDGFVCYGVVLLRRCSVTHGCTLLFFILPIVALEVRDNVSTHKDLVLLHASIIGPQPALNHTPPSKLS